MSIFLAPVPIIHVQAMLDELSCGHKRFAFGSNAQVFDWKYMDNVEAENITAYIYVSETGKKSLDSSANKQLGISIKGRLCSFVKADNLGQYPKDGKARRPISSSDDTSMTFFWEIDNIERLLTKKRLSDFISATTSKKFANGFIPLRPMWVNYNKAGAYFCT